MMCRSAPSMSSATILRTTGVYVKRGDYAKALKFFGETLEVLQHIGLREGEGATRNSIGFIYNKLDRHQEALESYREALAISRALGDRPMEGTTLNNIGMIYDLQGEWQQAIDFYQQSIAVKESVRTSARLEEFKTGLADQSMHVYERAIILLLDTFQPNQAFDLSERARARGFLDHIGNARFDIRKGGDAALIQQEQRLRLELTTLDGELRQERGKPGPQQNAERLQGLTTQLTAKQQQYEDYLTRLKLAN